MPTVVIDRTTTTLAGPFLLDSEQLAELDELLKKEWAAFQAYRRRALERQVRKELDAHLKAAGIDRDDKAAVDKAIARLKKSAEQFYPFNQSTREIEVVHSNEGRTIRGETFAELSRSPDAHTGHARGCTIKLKVNDLSCEIGINAGLWNHGDGEVRIDVKPPTSKQAQETFVTVRRFFEEHQEAMPVRTARSAQGAQWFVLAGLLLVELLAGVRHVSTPDTRYADAARLLDGGITPEEQPRAIELLLRLHVEAAPPSQTVMAPWFGPVALISIALAVALAFVPKAEFGIGRGNDRIRWWRRWIRTLYVTVPMSILTGVIAPYAGTLAKQYLHWPWW